MSHNMQQYGVSECTKKRIAAYIMKDCAMSIFFWVKTMMNADKIVNLVQSVWWTTYYAAGEKCSVTLHRDSKVPDISMTEHT